MKLQPAQHGPARPAPSDEEGVGFDACLAAHAQATVAMMPLSAADTQLAFFLPEAVKQFQQGMQGALPTRGVSGTPVGRLGRRRPSTASLCSSHDELNLIGKSPDRLITINRISVPIIWAHAGSTCLAKCIAPRYRQRNIAS
ncbi:hypothetical protein AOQ72_21355 [Bradyrhizobium yuanmingense]|uniref:Uncharacterized protein n=1 Tax=Bradyrhizobium yuanmingense TaxID=108015 RepID=A0A0R3C813_9BRAD|nr:hypothetical protein AOQ72_21355 [Bradyrhizobium yuanmingense]